MTMRDTLTNDVAAIVGNNWNVTPGRVVPDLAGLTLSNTGKQLRACILYADLSDSTVLVDVLLASKAAEYYKAFLLCASKLIVQNGGTIEAFDGDRVMGVFLGEGRADSAVKTALQLHTAVREVLTPALCTSLDAIPLKYTVGIDDGEVLVCKAGVRGGNDLVWVGPAANYAAKLNSFKGLDHAFPTRITERVFALLGASSRISLNGDLVWDGPYKNVNQTFHYRSSMWWTSLDG